MMKKRHMPMHVPIFYAVRPLYLPIGSSGQWKYDFQNRFHAPMEKSHDNTATKYLESLRRKALLPRGFPQR